MSFEYNHFCWRQDDAGRPMYTLSYLKNERDVSMYSGRRCLCFPTCSKTHKLMHKGCTLQRVSLSALRDLTVVLVMRQKYRCVSHACDMLTLVPPICYVLTLTSHKQVWMMIQLLISCLNESIHSYLVKHILFVIILSSKT